MRELTLFSKIQGAKPALLGPMSSDQGNTLTHALVPEPYSSVQVRMGALQVVLYYGNRFMCSLASCHAARYVGRGRETHRHDYTRPPAALGDELGGFSTSLGLFASPPLILSTESVVVMKWKGVSTAIATRAASPAVHPQRLRRCRSQARNRHYSGP